MAATAAYVDVVPAGRFAPAASGHRETNISSTTAAFALSQGVYMITCKASTYGTVALAVQAADGSTFVTVKNLAGTAASFSADGSLNVELATGAYKIVLA